MSNIYYIILNDYNNTLISNMALLFYTIKLFNEQYLIIYMQLLINTFFFGISIILKKIKIQCYLFIIIILA